MAGANLILDRPLSDLGASFSAASLSDAERLARMRKMLARVLAAPVVRRSANPIIISDLP
jgi:hypothetical protein